MSAQCKNQLKAENAILLHNLLIYMHALSFPEAFQSCDIIFLRFVVNYKNCLEKKPFGWRNNLKVKEVYIILLLALDKIILPTNLTHKRNRTANGRNDERSEIKLIHFVCSHDFMLKNWQELIISVQVWFFSLQLWKLTDTKMVY